MEFKDLQKILEKIDKLPENCYKSLLKSCIDSIEHHLELYNKFGKCIYCEKEKHICENMCECWKVNDRLEKALDKLELADTLGELDEEE